MKSGVQTTEFWGKSLVQLVLVLNAVFDLGLDLDDTTSLTIVGGLEATYQFGRSFVKALRGKFSTTVNNVK